MSSSLIKDPIYQQLNQILRALLESGEMAIGDKFLTERDISKRYGVSRTTANKALSSLVSEGCLEFRKGVGTFVAARRMDYDLRNLVSFTNKADTAGKTPSTEIISFDSVLAGTLNDELQAFLKLQEHDRAFSMMRLRSADSSPVILERRYVAAHHCPGLTREEVGGSIYQLWTEKYGLDIIGANQVISAVNIESKDARLLGVASGTAGFLVVSTGFIRGQEPLWHEKTLYRGDAYQFTNSLGNAAAVHAAVGVLRS